MSVRLNIQSVLCLSKPGCCPQTGAYSLEGLKGVQPPLNYGATVLYKGQAGRCYVDAPFRNQTVILTQQFREL